MSIMAPGDDLSILSRNHLLAEAERMARQLRGLELATVEVLHERDRGAPDSVALRMLLSAIQGLRTIE